jgi:sterol desaturase/sphingolipid hydroxylase (fatty acid hydroxylase superfamily)
MPPLPHLLALTFGGFVVLHAVVLAALTSLRRLTGRGEHNLRLDGTGVRYALEFIGAEALLLTVALQSRVVVLAPFSAPRTLAVLAIGFVWWEGWFYAGHRLLHTRALFPLHRPHHATPGLHPSLCFSAGETALLSSSFYVPLGLASHAFHAVSLPTLALLFTAAYALNALQHLATDPAAGSPARPGLIHTARDHARHHAGEPGNFGLVTPWFDRLFGTELGAVSYGGASSAERSAAKAASRAARSGVSAPAASPSSAKASVGVAATFTTRA